MPRRRRGHDIRGYGDEISIGDGVDLRLCLLESLNELRQCADRAILRDTVFAVNLALHLTFTQRVGACQHPGQEAPPQAAFLVVRVDEEHRQEPDVRASKRGRERDDRTAGAG